MSCARIREPDIGDVHRLAHMQLCARRDGRELCFTDASAELVALIELAGLAGVLRVEVRRQPEEREQPRRVEEEGDVGDLPV